MEECGCANEGLIGRSADNEEWIWADSKNLLGWESAAIREIWGGLERIFPIEEGRRLGGCFKGKLGIVCRVGCNCNWAEGKICCKVASLEAEDSFFKLDFLFGECILWLTTIGSIVDTILTARGAFSTLVVM